MRTACMCFSVLQGPRCGIQYFLKGNLFLQPFSVVNYSTESFPSLRSIPGSSCKPVDSNTCRASSEGLYTGKWRQETLRMKEQRKANITQSSKPCTVKPDDLLDATVAVDHKINISKTDLRDSKHIEYDVQVKVGESQKIQRLVTIFVFDSETTGFNKGKDRIIEFALRDLVGGKNSTFQSLVNPERHVPNTHIHGISTHMVNGPDVPRFAELIPILLHYVQTRQISGAPVLWVAHNARSFDVPFLINEFNRCSVEIPSDWLFLDTLPLAHELNKLEGPKLLAGKSLKALREFYEIPLVGEAHRAMADVDSLSKVLRHMSIDLKLSVPALLERSFKASDIINTKKKASDIINTKKKTTN